jgi:hypothetical protein
MKNRPVLKTTAPAEWLQEGCPAAVLYIMPGNRLPVPPV